MKVKTYHVAQIVAEEKAFDEGEYEKSHLLRLAESIRRASLEPGIHLGNLVKTASRYIENHKNTKHTSELNILIAIRDSLISKEA